MGTDAAAGKESWSEARGQVRKLGFLSQRAAFAWLTGIVLADMLPEMRQAIMARAREIGLNRVIGGIHYPSDVKAGRLLTVACAVEIRDNPAFLADFEEARQEVRKGLGLPLN